MTRPRFEAKPQAGDRSSQLLSNRAPSPAQPITRSPNHPLTPSPPQGVTSSRLVLALGLASSLLLAAAFPPIGFAPAVWLAPIGLVLLIRRPELVDPASRLGRHPYLALWG